MKLHLRPLVAALFAILFALRPRRRRRRTVLQRRPAHRVEGIIRGIAC